MSNSDKEYGLTDNIDDLLEDEGHYDADNSRQEWDDELKDDEDEDEVPKSPSKKGKSRASKELDDELDDEEEDELEDDEDEPKAFLSTKNGKIFLAAAAVGVGVVGFVGYTNLSGSGSSDESLPQESEMDLPPVSQPETVASIKPQAATLPVAPAPQALPEASIPVPGEASNVVKNDFAGEIKEQSAVPPVAVDVLDDQLSEKAKHDAIEQAVKKAMDAQKAEMAEIIESSVNASIASLQKAVVESTANDEAKESEIRARVEAEYKEKERQELLDQQQQLKLESDAKADELKKQEEERKTLLEKLKSGRTQVQGFQIVNQTKDGKMAVVKSPSSQIHVYFVGEKIRIADEGVKTVSAIEDQGRIMLIGDNLYVDETLAVPVVKKKEIVKKPSEPKERTSQPRQARTHAKQSAGGWKLNGVFPDGYLLQTPKGEWITVNTGGSIPGVGKVHGLDGNGNLSVGGTVIKKADE
ncbi:hypothetical protein [Aeromonas sp. MrichA-1]|uniref:hypothetical protein n=1 Tax=Aeromonas sp. MrichA-1 TaxID=2823362 RepID=UPI001B338278|nr:hypothetical protein [Aeromonas sp. MrichA-1]MBP4081411.1 hypothetical protein [Aeromonas sp. MrichA-1]